MFQRQLLLCMIHQIWFLDSTCSGFICIHFVIWIHWRKSWSLFFCNFFFGYVTDAILVKMHFTGEVQEWALAIGRWDRPISISRSTWGIPVCKLLLSNEARKWACCYPSWLLVCVANMPISQFIYCISYISCNKFFLTIATLLPHLKFI